MGKVMEQKLLEDPMDKAIQLVTAMQAIGGGGGTSKMEDWALDVTSARFSLSFVQTCCI